VSAFLLGTAALLLLSERIGARRKELGQLTPRDALWIGLGQVLSLFPGVSRSGATIAVGLGRDLQRAEAARFSFLMAVPVMLGAGVVAVVELLKSVDWIDQLGPLLAGFISAALVGYVAIGWLIAFLKRRPLRVFAAYCLLVGLGGLILGALRA
jgi:undecaprenyl-diphosphatase